MTRKSNRHDRNRDIKSAARVEDPRRRARELALQFLYQLTVQNGENLDQLEKFLAEFGTDDQDRELARSWIRGAWQQQQQIDRMVQAISSNWDLNRISLVDRNNLRLAVYQMLYQPEIPTKVVINEAIELAKTFSTAQSSSFINGLLDTLQHKINADANNSECT